MRSCVIVPQMGAVAQQRSPRTWLHAAILQKGLVAAGLHPKKTTEKSWAAKERSSKSRWSSGKVCEAATCYGLLQSADVLFLLQ